MKQSLTPDCLRFLVFDFNTSQALLCALSVMYSCNFSLFHRENSEPYSGQAFLPFKVTRRVFTDPLMISRTIKASPVKLCTVIGLRNPARLQKEIFKNLTYDVH